MLARPLEAGAGRGFDTTRMRTLAIPAPTKPRACAVALETSSIRPPMEGPRSLMRTTTERPFRRLVISTQLPNGSSGWAAVSPFISNTSPVAVTFPWNSSPYQLATPSLGTVTGGTAWLRPIGTARKLGDHRSVIARAEPNRYFFINLPSGRHAPTPKSMHLPRESFQNIQNLEGFVKMAIAGGLPPGR
jgi:hypothetical protein